MEAGLNNITNTSQHLFPSSLLSDFRILSPPLTPPPSSFNRNGNIEIPMNNNIPYICKKSHMNSSKGNSPLPLNFNNHNISSFPDVYPFNPVNKKLEFDTMNNSSINPNLPPIPHPFMSHYHVQQIYVPNKLIGCVIGKQGDCIKHIRNISGSQIKISEPNPNSTERLITISGNSETNRIAIHMILDRLENERNKFQ